MRSVSHSSLFCWWQSRFLIFLPDSSARRRLPSANRGKGVTMWNSYSERNLVFILREESFFQASDVKTKKIRMKEDEDKMT